MWPCGHVSIRNTEYPHNSRSQNSVAFGRVQGAGRWWPGLAVKSARQAGRQFVSGAKQAKNSLFCFFFFSICLLLHGKSGNFHFLFALAMSSCCWYGKWVSSGNVWLPVHLRRTMDATIVRLLLLVSVSTCCCLLLFLYELWVVGVAAFWFLCSLPVFTTLRWQLNFFQLQQMRFVARLPQMLHVGNVKPFHFRVYQIFFASFGMRWRKINGYLKLRA